LAAKFNVGRKYPEVVLIRLARLQASISALDPSKRPSAIEVFEELQGMALANWEKGEYFLPIKWHNP
jgi:hypothetical protein